MGKTKCDLPWGMFSDGKLRVGIPWDVRSNGKLTVDHRGPRGNCWEGLTVYPGACGPMGNDSFIFILISFFMSAILLDTAERVTQNNQVILIKCGHGNLKPFKDLVFCFFSSES